MKQNLYELTNPQKPIWLTEQYFTNTSVNTICGYTFITDYLPFNEMGLGWCLPAILVFLLATMLTPSNK